MTSDAFIRVLAGSMILVSLALAHFFSPWWLVFTAFIALNLIQSAFTGFCPPEFLARRLGWVKGAGTCARPAPPVAAPAVKPRPSAR